MRWEPSYSWKPEIIEKTKEKGQFRRVITLDLLGLEHFLFFFFTLQGIKPDAFICRKFAYKVYRNMKVCIKTEKYHFSAKNRKKRANFIKPYIETHYS